jgi:vacuolar-type H+-ATPase subunit H
MKSHIQEVLEIEKKAQAIHAAAIKKAEQLPLAAEREAQTLLEKARRDAEEEARRLVEAARAQGEAERILAQAGEDASQMKTLAAQNLQPAVSYVLDRVAGRE